MRGLSLVAASGGYSSSRCAGLSLSRLLLLRSTGSGCAGAVGVAHGPSCPAACGMWDVGSSQTRARTRVPCIGGQILNHCATREGPHSGEFKQSPACLSRRQRSRCRRGVRRSWSFAEVRGQAGCERALGGKARPGGSGHGA